MKLRYSWLAILALVVNFCSHGLAQPQYFYVDLVNMLKSRGVKVEAISFPKSTAKELIEAVSHYRPLEKEILIHGRGNS